MNVSLVSLIIAGLALGATATQPAVAATADNACGIPLATVSSAVGAPIVRTRPQPDISSCAYESARPVPSVTVTTYREDSPAEASAMFKKLVTGLSAAAGGSDPITKVSGVGDEAAVVEGLLYARKGTAIYVITVLDSMRGPAKLPRAEKLAKLVFATSKP